MDKNTRHDRTPTLEELIDKNNAYSDSEKGFIKGLFKAVKIIDKVKSNA